MGVFALYNFILLTELVFCSFISLLACLPAWLQCKTLALILFQGTMEELCQLTANSPDHAKILSDA